MPKAKEVLAMAETHFLAKKECFEAYLKTFDQVQLFYYTLALSLLAYIIIFHGISWLQSIRHQIWLEHGLYKYFSKRIFGLTLYIP